MTPEARQALLDYILRNWQGFKAKDRPDRMLVREYASAPEDGNPLEWPERFWVLDAGGYQEQCVVQSQRLQAIEQLVPGGSALKRENLYETGNVVFAPFPEPGQFYLHRVFGPRAGVGSQIEIDAEGRVIWKKRLWVS